MGMISTLLKLSRAKLQTKGNAPGKSVVMTGEGVEGQSMTAEVYQAPGILAMPGDGTRGIWVPVGGSSRYGVVVAAQNYAINITVEAGETAIFSTTADGKTVQALIKLKADGTIELNGNDKRLVTHAELDTALQTFITALNLHTHTSAAAGSPTTPPVASLSLDISAAETETIKTGG
jgi:phage gp45-like